MGNLISPCDVCGAEESTTELHQTLFEEKGVFNGNLNGNDRVHAYVLRVGPLCYAKQPAAQLVPIIAAKGVLE